MSVEWTEAEMQALHDGLAAGDAPQQIAARLSARSAKAVRMKLQRIRAGTRVPEPAPTVLPKPEPPPRPDPTNAEIMRLEARNRQLNQELREIRAKLAKLQEHDEVFERLAEVVRSEAEPIKVRPRQRPTRRMGKTAGRCSMVLLLSDEHADAVISSEHTWGLERYGFDVFRTRLSRLAHVIEEHVEQYLPAHDIEELFIFSLGDKVQGGIHGMELRNAFQNTMRAAVATGDAEAEFVARIEPLFPNGVHWVAVSGNHPRQTMRKDFHGPLDNFDYLSTVQVASRLRGLVEAGRVSLHAPNSWTAFVEVRGKMFALNHGDDVKGWAGIPWYGFDRKNQRIQAVLAQVDERVDYFCYGHYHTPIEAATAGARSLHNGSFMYTDPYALNKLSVGNAPQQNLYVVTEKHGVVLPIPVFLRHDESEAALASGKYEPELGRSLTADIVTPRTGGGFNVVGRTAA